MRGPSSGRWEPWLLTAAAAAAVLGVLCPDLYADAVDHVVTTLVGHH
ncbi:hypothetical protein ACFVW1_18260 [Streptomyces olivochromogenes]